MIPVRLLFTDAGRTYAREQLMDPVSVALIELWLKNAKAVKSPTVNGGIAMPFALHLDKGAGKEYLIHLDRLV